MKGKLIVKKRWQSIFFWFSLVLIFFVLSIFSFFLWYGKFFAKDLLAIKQPVQYNFKYHFVMIAQKSTETQKIYQIACETAKRENSVIEYLQPNAYEIKELERFLEMSILADVDGILLSVPNQTAFQFLINEAIQKKIPVVTMANDIDGCQRSSFVGANTYELGYKTSKLLSLNFKKSLKIAVLVNGNFSTLSYRNYLNGLRKGLQNRPNLDLKLIINSKGESISAEDQAQFILKNHPEIEAIICSDPNDTLGVAKVVVDLNRVTKVTIIGSGLTTEIANYLTKGVISAVLAIDPSELGVQAVNTILRYKQNQAINEIYYMPLFIVDAKNVKQMIQRLNFK